MSLGGSSQHAVMHVLPKLARQSIQLGDGGLAQGFGKNPLLEMARALSQVFNHRRDMVGQIVR